jgi:hypothetical protein
MVCFRRAIRTPVRLYLKGCGLPFLHEVLLAKGILTHEMKQPNPSRDPASGVKPKTEIASNRFTSAHSAHRLQAWSALAR